MGNSTTDEQGASQNTKGPILTGLASCRQCLIPKTAVPNWGYGAANGPEVWADLSEDYAIGKTGQRQSPIDLQTTAAEAVNLSAPQRNWPETTPFRAVNTGLSFAGVLPENITTHFKDQEFHLVQFHFHHPSEHLLDGKAHDMEVHFVHTNASGDLLVLGAFIKAGAHNEALQVVWDAMPSARKEAEAQAELAMETLLPNRDSFFLYDGSLTTPPLAEGVTWVVYEVAIEASAEQIAFFEKHHPNSARPVQPLNGRSVKRCSN